MAVLEKISDYESDDLKNAEKLKKTRHSRAMKIKEDYTTETPAMKRKALAPIQNIVTVKKLLVNQSPISIKKEKLELSQIKPSDTPSSEIMTETELGEQEPPEQVAHGTGPSDSEEHEANLFEIESQEAASPEKEQQHNTKQLENIFLENELRKIEEQEAETVRTAEKPSEIPNDQMDPKIVYRKLCSIDAKVSRLSNDSNNNNGKENIVQFGEGKLHVFPIKSVDEMANVEQLFTKSRFKMTAMEAAILLGKCKNCSTTVANLMCHLMTYETGNKYSFDGRRYKGVKKPAFKNLKICSFIINAVMTLMKADKQTIRAGIKQWLYHAKQNGERLKTSLENKNEAERQALFEEENISSDEE